MTALADAPALYALLLATGVAAGFIDAIAGGGGLLTLPVLLGTGLPPTVALGTNKLQGSFGSVAAAWHYGRAGLIDWRGAAAGVAATFAGAVAGTWLVSRLPPEALRVLVPALLVAVAVAMLLQPRLGAADGPARVPVAVFHGLGGLGLGFYDGFFGPGTGTLWAFAYVALLGYGLVRATAHTKLMNATSNLASLAVFAAAGYCDLAAGIAMGLGQLVGARLGAGLVIRRGAALVRPLFIAVALALSARLLWQATQPG